MGLCGLGGLCGVTGFVGFTCFVCGACANTKGLQRNGDLTVCFGICGFNCVAPGFFHSYFGEPERIWEMQCCQIILGICGLTVFSLFLITNLGIKQFVDLWAHIVVVFYSRTALCV